MRRWMTRRKVRSVTVWKEWDTSYTTTVGIKKSCGRRLNPTCVSLLWLSGISIMQGSRTLQVNIWKFIYLNYGEWNESMIDHRSYTLNLSSWEIKDWKQFRPERSIMLSFHSPQFKYMNFHIFTCTLHLLRVYYELTKWPAPSWLDSSVGRALHRYRRGHGFESRSGLNFFQALISQLLKLSV